MNQKKSNKNITGIQAEDAPKSTRKQEGNRFISYRFEIMDDDNIYSISFRGKLTEEETRKMLESIQNCLYEKAADGIQGYLEQHNLPFTGFTASRKPVEHSGIMELANLFLHLDNCSGFNSYFENADIYFLIADHQKWTAQNCCQGCYLAVKKAFPKSGGLFNIIGQIFSCNEINGDENCYFAIRKSRGNEQLCNVDASAGEAVLPAFGCVDIIGVLLNIDNIQTTKQAVQIALK